MVFLFASPAELVLPIEPFIREQAERHSHQVMQGQWNVYLNEIAVHTVLPWLQTDFSPEAQIWLAAELPDLWRVVNGTAITIDGKRFVIIPSQLIEGELTVSQAWIDIPTWAGDYFLAVQVDVVGEWLRIWGYTTHAQLKIQGEYNTVDRTYSLDATQLIEITALSVVYQLNPDEQTQAAIEPISTLSESQVQALLEDLNHQQFPFHQWGALLMQPDTRSHLYINWKSTLSNLSVNLANWLQHQFEESWQSIETLLQPQLYSLRHPLNSPEICRARSIQLSVDHHVSLVVLLEPDRDLPEERPPNIRIRLYPGERPFPVNLNLTLLTESGEAVQTVQADEQAEFIQLKRFRCRTGTSFQVQITIDTPIFTELFVN